MYVARRTRRLLATDEVREVGLGVDAGATVDAGAGSGDAAEAGDGAIRGADAALGAALSAVERSVDGLVEIDLGPVGESQLRAATHAVQRQRRRLEAVLMALAGQLAARQATRLHSTGPADPRVRQQAEQRTQRELAETLRMSYSEAKRTTTADRELDRHAPAARQALRDGQLSTEHAAMLARTMRDLSPAVAADGGPEAQRLEAELLTAATRQQPAEFGRTCRRLLARHAPARASRDLERLKTRRYGNLTQGTDGMVHLRAGFAGIDAEIVATAIEAFRTPDGRDGHRTTDQRGADAIVAALKCGLDHADGSEHGNRPHLLVRVDWPDLVAGAHQVDEDDDATGTATTTATAIAEGDGSGDDGEGRPGGRIETTFTGPLPAGELRRLLDDATISRIVTGPDSQVIDVGRATRTVTGAAWRGMVARDGGCTLDGCGAPPARCQAAHIDRRWVDGAGTSLREQALACWGCHAIIDRLGLTGRHQGGRIVWYRRDGTPYRRHPGPARRARGPDQP